MTARTLTRPAAALALAALLAAPALAQTATAVAQKSPNLLPVRGANTLPSGLSFTRGPLPAAATALGDTFLLRSNAFQTWGDQCRDRGWTGQDRSGLVFAHVAAKAVNRANVTGLPNTVGQGYPAPVTGTLLTNPGAIAVTDSGNVVYWQRNAFLAATSLVLGVEVYKPQNLLRSYGASPDLDVRPTSATLADAGRIVVSMSGELWRYEAGGGTPVRVAGNAAGSSQDTLATDALIQPTQVAADAAGNVYFAEPATERVRMLRTDGRIVTVAGQPGSPGSAGDGGPASAAQLAGPQGVAVDRVANVLYIADTQSGRIRRVDLATGIITTAWLVADPKEIAWSAPWLYVRLGSLDETHSILRINDSGASMVYGMNLFYQPASASQSGLQMDGRAVGGMVSDGAGGLYFTDSGHHMVWHLDTDGILSPWVGYSWPVAMGTQSLWFGADMTSHPDEVENWVFDSGYGESWSQRLVSPAIDLAAHPNATVSFNLALGFDDIVSDGEFLSVQGQRPDGSWVTLKGVALLSASPSLTSSDGTTTNGFARGSAIYYGSGIGIISVPLGSEGNEFLGLGATTRVRIVVQSTALGSAEDGRIGLNIGAAAIDDLRVTDSDTNAPLVPAQDFEGGTLGGGWTLTAFNGPDPGPGYAVYDAPAPATTATLRSGFDFSDPTCVWTFTTGADEVPTGAFVRLESPWIGLADKTQDALIALSGKFNTVDQQRLVRVLVRAKDAGQTRPGDLAVGNFLLNGGVVTGGDIAVPFLRDFVLRYPTDFQSNLTRYDSIQVVLQVEDHAPDRVPGSAPTRFPYFDDLKVAQVGVDSDGDGVADAADACPAVSAAGQDADGDGCIDATATNRHVESWPLSIGNSYHYLVSQNAVPGITDGSDLTAVFAGFGTWPDVSGASVVAVNDSLTARVNASALDGVNLVTFEDGSLQFPPDIVGVTPTLSFTHQGVYDDVVVPPGTIVDADMIINPVTPLRTATATTGIGALDLQSVVTHEAGHFLGINHSGVLDATMFYVLQPDTTGRTLTDDDRAAIASAYPSNTLATSFGTITGTVLRGATSQPIPGALVTAVRLQGAAPVDSTASDYTRLDGSYALRRLPPGDYAVRVTPLDGEVGGYPLTPAQIGPPISVGAQTNFQAEWWSDPDTDRDDPALLTPIAVGAGATRPDIVVVTNTDTLAPVVVSVSPPADSTGIRIDTSVLVVFSERVAAASLQQAFRLHADGDATRLSGQGLLVDGGRRFFFTPAQPLAFGTAYVLDITTDLTDDEGVPLAATFSTRFTTEVQPTVAISSIQPPAATPGSLVTINGVGFDASSLTATRVLFTLAPGQDQVTIDPVSVTPTSLVVPVRFDAITGPVRVIVGADSSNAFGFTIMPYPTQVAPTALGTPVPLAFSPSDVAVAPDALTVFAVGDGGLATINLDPGRPDLRTAVVRPLGALSRLALTPDGLRGFASRATDGSLVEVDTDPTSGTFGEPLASVPLGGDGPFTPGAVAIDGAGRRAFVAEAGGSRIAEIDIDVASVTRNSVRRMLGMAGLAGSGGLSVSPDGATLGTTSSNLGTVLFDLPTGLPTFTGSSNSALQPGGVAFTPDGVFYMSTGASGEVHVVTVPSAIPQMSTTLSLGGEVRDAVVTPQGQSGLVVNSALNKLQVLNLDSGLPAYGTLVSEISTGSVPVALSISQDASLIAVANAGSHDVALFANGAGATLSALYPPVASPGDLVVARGGSPGVFLPSTQIDFGGALGGAENVVPSSAGFRVPIVPQGAVNVALQTGTERTGSLPFEVVAPLPAPTPDYTGLTFPIQLNQTNVNFANVDMQRMQVSPDGRVLVVGFAQGPQSVGSRLVLMSAEARRGRPPFSARLANAATTGAYSDWVFSHDGKRAFTKAVDPGWFVIDTDPNSASFGSGIGVASFPSVPVPSDIAWDPFGRWLYVSDFTNVFKYDAATNAEIGIIPAASGELLPTPDGRYLLLVRPDVVAIHDALSGSLWALTPTTGNGLSASSMVVSSDGRRLIASTGNTTGVMMVWNLDVAAGTLGALLWQGVPAGLSTPLAELVPSPDGSGVLGITAGGALVRVDLATFPGTATPLPAPNAYRHIARSLDGRLLFGSYAFQDVDSLYARVDVLSLAEPAALALGSGGDQSAPFGADLPQPVRVRVTGAGDAPVAGALVRFTITEGAGVLDGEDADVIRRTGPNGEVELTWHLADVPGTYHLTASVLGTALTTSTTAVAAANDADIVPVLVALGPADGTTNVGAGTAVFARFNQRMDSTSVATRLTLHSGNSPVAGSFDLEGDGTLMLFRPQQPLPFGSTCMLAMAAGALDTDGQALVTGGASTFTVQPQPQLALSALVPPAAPVGAPVTLQGAGFSAVNAQNIVLVNGKLAPVSSASATALVVNVPAGANTGPVTVQVGTATSNAVTLTVTEGSGVGGVIGTVEQAGASRVAFTQDGLRAVVTSTQTNSAAVVDVEQLTTLKTVTVGSQPRGVAILGNRRAYIANEGSDDVSVIDLALGSPTLYQVVRTIPVGDAPVAVAISASRNEVYVVNSGDGTLSIIDADSLNATWDQVTASVDVGSNAQGIAITPDGGRAYVVTAGGLMVVIDLAGRAVTASVDLGSNAQGIAITPDGATALVLLGNGTLVAIDIVPGSPQENQVVASVDVGSNAQGIAITPDGGTAYVTQGDDGTVLVIQIGSASQGEASSIVPSGGVTLTLIATIEVGQAPAGIAIAATGEPVVLVANTGSGTVTAIGVPTFLPPIPVEFDFNPNAFNLKVLGRWVSARIEPPAPWTPQMVDLESVRLEGTVPWDSTGPVTYGDGDGDGRPDVMFKFSRNAVQLVLSEGEKVYVHVTGLFGTQRTFAGVDSIKVQRGHVTAPVAGQSLVPGTAMTVTWESPENTAVTSVTLLHTVDGGRTWVTDASGLPNTGSAPWTVPATATDSAKVAVLFTVESPDTAVAPVDESGSADDVVFGVLAVSDFFHVVGTTDAQPAPRVLSFSRIQPNPASGSVALRFGLPVTGPVRLEVFDISGRRVRTLVDGVHAAGWHESRWLGDNDAAGRVGAGLYFVRLRAAGRDIGQRLVWMP